MQAAEVDVPQNQIASLPMGRSDAQVPANMPESSDPSLGGGALAAGAFALALAAGFLGIFSSGSATPLLLTVLGLLAALGLFFLLGLAAGHVRLSQRISGTEILDRAADRLDTGILVTTADGTPVYANRRLYEIGNLRDRPTSGVLERLVGTGTAGQAALFRLNRAAARLDSLSEDIELAGTLDTGLARTLRLTVRPFDMPGTERDIQYGRQALWTVTDVTVDRRRERQARDTLLATLAHYDQAPAGLLIVGEDGLVRCVNATLAAWLGHDRKVTGLKLGDLVAPDGVELLMGLFARSETAPFTVEIDFNREDRRILPARLVCRVNPDSQGRVLSLVVTVTENGAGSQSPRDAQSIEERFTRFFQSAPFGIATVGIDGTIGSPNGAFARMILDGTGGLGRVALDVLGRDSDAETKAAIEAGLKHVISGRGNLAPVEVTVGADKKHVRRVYMNPLTASGTSGEAAILYVIDATEHKVLEAKFAQSSKMEAVGKLAGGVAHDFNNMLTAIIGFSDMLLAMHRPTDLAYKDLRNIKSSAERAAGLVGKLLAFSRQQTLLRETLQLGEVLTDLAPLLKQSLGETIDLRMTTGRDLWTVKADKIQLERAIINLAVNARDAMPAGGTLSIRTRNVNEREVQKLDHLGMTVGEYVLVEVEDTGTGMSAEVLAQIFEPFFTTKGVGKGTGLGLATVYGIIKQTGGFIFPDSTVGKGTAFRVYLPRHHADAEDQVQTEKAAAAAVQKSSRPADLTGTGRVLLVEDEDVVRSFAVRALKSRGYEVLEASSGVEALEVMAGCNWAVDIVVSDVVMPEMDGPTLLKELRARNPRIKIIFVSGYPNEAFKQQLDENEEFAFLPKPFSLPQLAAKVKEELGR